MKPQKPFLRFLLGAAIVLIVILAGFAWVSAVTPTWGSTAEETARALPADEIVQDVDFFWNHAVTVRAPAEEVYRWLIQIGDSRAAFYSIQFIENAFCATSGECRYLNADRIHPEWQNPEKGRQGIIMDYMLITDYSEIRDNQPGAWVLAQPSEKLPFQWTWLWYVEPVDAAASANAASSRLIVRHRVDFPPDVPAWAVRAVFDTGYVMERAMILGIQARAEGRVPSPLEEPLGALIWLLVLGMGIAAAVRFIRVADGYHTLGVGLEAVVVLFVLTYVQPPMLWRFVLLLMVAAGVVVTFWRGAVRKWVAALGARA